jgi:hypothetical protein
LRRPQRVGVVTAEAPQSVEPAATPASSTLAAANLWRPPDLLAICHSGEQSLADG